jgi:type I restriction-modification system DNA methylase subunit
MARRRQRAKDSRNDGATLGSAAELWQMADAPRGSMDAAEHEHVVLGLLFLKSADRRGRQAAAPHRRRRRARFAPAVEQMYSAY